MSGKADSLKTIFYALGANFAIFLAKAFAAFVTGSGAMTAEAVHSLADCGNQCLLLLGLKDAKAPASPDHPLGHGKAIYFWSFLVALLLFSVGGAFSIYEGIHKLNDPEPLKWPWLAIGVLAFGIVAESFSMWGC
ncbi:MAG: cation diffusion facilitator family transporter, partial [Dokdonella sp.]